MYAASVASVDSQRVKTKPFINFDTDFEPYFLRRRKKKWFLNFILWYVMT